MITIEPDPDSAGEPQLGILRSYVDDLNGDGKKEMAVLRIGFRKDEYGQEPYSALILDLYQIMNGEMINFGTEELRTIGPVSYTHLCETVSGSHLYHRTGNQQLLGDPADCLRNRRRILRNFQYYIHGGYLPGDLPKGKGTLSGRV